MAVSNTCNIYYKHTHAYKFITYPIKLVLAIAAVSFLYLYNMYIVTVIVVSQWWSRSVSGDGGGDENY